MPHYVPRTFFLSLILSSHRLTPPPPSSYSSFCLQDFGYAQVLRWQALDAAGSALHPALQRLASDASYAAAVQLARARNAAAGGVPRALQIMEATAALGPHGHLHAIPRAHFLPWYVRAELDVALPLLAALALCAWLLWRAVCVCARCCLRGCARKQKQA